MGREGIGRSGSGNDGKKLTLIFTKNGSGHTYAASHFTGATAYVTVNGSCLAELAAGDRIRLEVSHNDVVSQIALNWSSTTFLWGYRIK